VFRTKIATDDCVVHLLYVIAEVILVGNVFVVTRHVLYLNLVRLTMKHVVMLLLATLDSTFLGRVFAAVLHEVLALQAVEANFALSNKSNPDHLRFLSESHAFARPVVIAEAPGTVVLIQLVRACS
jgi:hypothetical protein